MPTYEYRCTQCGHRFDIFQRIADDPLTACERCGGELRKVFHPAGIVFKGSGFYATDSRSSTSKSSGTGDGKGDGKTADTKGSDTKGTDTKDTGTKSGDAPAKKATAKEPS